MEKMKEAENRIKTIDRTQLIKLSDIRDPPPPIVNVFQMLGVLFQPETSSDAFVGRPVRQLVRQTNFIEKMLNFDRDQLSVEQWNRLGELLKQDKMKENDMDRYSKIAGHLLAWIIAVESSCDRFILHQDKNEMLSLYLSLRSSQLTFSR